MFILVKKKGTYLGAINLQDVAEIHKNSKLDTVYVKFLTGNHILCIPGLTDSEIEFLFAQIAAANK